MSIDRQTVIGTMPGKRVTGAAHHSLSTDRSCLRAGGS
jgi:hypothetical protein